MDVVIRLNPISVNSSNMFFKLYHYFLRIGLDWQPKDACKAKGASAKVFSSFLSMSNESCNHITVPTRRE